MSTFTHAERERLPDYSSAPNVLERIGRWVAWHYRGRAMQADTQTAARQLRKQGYPIEVALLILAHRGPADGSADAVFSPSGRVFH